MIKTEGPLVSVIIPVYNAELYLEECLDSIIRQTLHDIEIICVDDGSTDGSAEILKTKAETDSRIQIIRQWNQGSSEARNTGIRVSSGEYLFFLDSDDKLVPDALEACVDNMIRRDLDILCFNIAAYGDDSETAILAGDFNHTYFKRILDDEMVYTGQELFAEMKQQDIFFASIQSCMYRRSSFIEHDVWFHPGILHEDEPWMLAVLMSSARCGCLNRILYQYRIHNNSIIQKAASFADVYGYFRGILDAEKQMQNPRNERVGELLVQHIAELQRKTIYKYAQCSEEEQEKRKNLAPGERFLFEQMIAFPSSLANQAKQCDDENIKLREKYDELKNQIRIIRQDEELINQQTRETIKEKDRQIKKQEKEIGKRKEETAFLKQENKKLQKKIKRVEKSETWRAGSMIIWLPGKTKRLLKKSFLKQSSFEDTKKQTEEKNDVESAPVIRENTMEVLSSEAFGNHVVFRYSISGKWSSCFSMNRIYEISYPFDVESIPESIRIIPFLSQVLPVSWIWDAEIRVAACDRDFYDCLEKVKDGYKKMYPMYSFDGKLTVDSIEEHRKPEEGQKALVCFSGGVDATSTTLSHLAEEPLLVSLWGADVPWDDTEGWKPVEATIRKNAETLGLDQMTVQTSFRKLLREGVLNKCVLASGDNWYHGFQHGIGILGHMAPVAWHEGIGTVYIASSNIEGTVYTCASDPSIDNFVRFCGAKVVHDGYEMDRQEKIQRITDFSRKNGLQIPLHVCWEKRGGENCCHCEKCWRTILGFFAAGEDPKQYGFPLFAGFDSLSDDLEQDYHRFRTLTVANYQPLQKKLQEKAAEGDLPQKLSWLVQADLPSVEEGALMPHKGELIRPAWLLGTPNHGNMGDQCIAEEEIHFLHSVMPAREIVEISEAELKRGHFSQLKKISPFQPIFLQGGGNLGTLWPKTEGFRREILKRIKDNPVVIFPQSIFFSQNADGLEDLAEAAKIYNGNNILLCCRDIVSYRFAQEHFGCKSVLVPDMVLWESRQKLSLQERYGALTLLRSDKEQKLSDNDRMTIKSVLTERFHSIEIHDTFLHCGKVTGENRNDIIDSMIRRISSVECVVTDRLHGMILCAVTGTPCVAFGNGYHKVEAFYEWLKPLGYIRFIQRTDELAGAIDEVCSCAERIYPEKEMRERFSELIRSITGL